jgi:hypothetical protein
MFDGWLIGLSFLLIVLLCAAGWPGKIRNRKS